VVWEGRSREAPPYPDWADGAFQENARRSRVFRPDNATT
jgi:hypothetical protein